MMRVELSMGTILHRLESGKRWWPAEIGLRFLGLCLLRLCAAAVAFLSRLIHQSPLHAVRPIEMLIAAVVFLSWSLGCALLFQGPELFRLADLPARHWRSPL
jgi:hypothetical protein